MPGVDIGAILAAIGDMLLQALMNALTNTISQLLTNAISDAIHGLAGTLENLLGPHSFLSQALDTFANNLVAELNQTVSGLLNGVNQIAQEAWGIIDAQQRLHEQLTNAVQGALDNVAQALHVEQEQRAQTGAAISAFFIGMLSEEPKRFGKIAETFLNSYEARLGQEMLRTGDTVKDMLGFLSSYIQADLKRVEEMPDDAAGAASDAIVQAAQQRIHFVYEWFMEAVVKPISLQDAFTYMFKVGISYSEDELVGQLKSVAKAQEKFVQDYMKEIEEKAQSMGIAPQ